LRNRSGISRQDSAEFSIPGGRSRDMSAVGGGKSERFKS
jgi:hypothetical protein